MSRSGRSGKLRGNAAQRHNILDVSLRDLQSVDQANAAPAKDDAEFVHKARRVANQRRASAVASIFGNSAIEPTR